MDLVTFVTAEDVQYIEEVRSLVNQLELVQRPRFKSGLINFLQFCYSHVPPPYINDRSRSMSRCVGNMMNREKYDLIIAEYSKMGQFLYRNRYLSSVRKIISCHHSPTVSMRKKLRLFGHGITAIADQLFINKTQQYEFQMYREMDRVLVLTAEEKNELLSYGLNVPVSVIPNGVNVDYFRRPGSVCVEHPSLLFTGFFADYANADAARWFLKKVWPALRSRHRDLHIYLVGPEPPRELQQMAAQDDRVVLTGRLDDVRPYLNRATVFVCPIRTGSGMRGKILEAMASKVPVVTTRIGSEGIDTKTGFNCFVADHEDEMVSDIELLLHDSLLRARMADRAYEMVAERYTWEYGVDRLEEIMKEVTGDRL